VPHLTYRLREAQKLGFTKAVIPPMIKKIDLPEGMQLYEARTLDEALRYVFQGSGIGFDVTREDVRAAEREQRRREREEDDDE
jgi:hypothetical protein